MTANGGGGTGPRRPLGRRLAFRLGVPLCVGAAAILVGAGVWNLRLQRDNLQRLVSASADRIAETIRRATRDAMMRDSPEEVRWMIESIAAQRGINRIRVFNKLGRITSSTEPREIGTQVDVRAEQCVACHQQDLPLDHLERADRVRIFRVPDGPRVLGIIAPIQNEPACASASCHVHDAAQRVLGVLDVQLDLGPADQELAASERQMVASLALGVLAVLLLSGVLTWWMVLRPIRRLATAISRVKAGDLSTRVSVGAPDDIGEMMESWNSMTEELGRARGELERWGRTLQSRVEEKTRDLERAHQRMLLVEKMASLGKLAAVVAHEINNPLAGIRTYARLLRRRIGATPQREGVATPAPDAESDRVLQCVEEEAARCGDIVRNLLLFSRTPGARLAEEELGPLVERCAFLLRHQAELKSVALACRVDPRLGRLVCDASQIQQMILALAMNGIEATPAGGSVTIEATDEGDAVALKVSDTGAGIPPEDRDRIFEPFFTTKREGASVGVGLGLAVVYGIVRRHGGQIDVDSRPGQGSVFTVRLPRRPPAGGGSEPREVQEVVA